MKHNGDDRTWPNEIGHSHLAFYSTRHPRSKEHARKKVWESRAVPPLRKQQKRMLPEYYDNPKPSRPERENSVAEKSRMLNHARIACDNHPIRFSNAYLHQALCGSVIRLLANSLRWSFRQNGISITPMNL